MSDPLDIDLDVLAAAARGAPPPELATVLARARGRVEIVGTIADVRFTSSREPPPALGSEVDPEDEIYRGERHQASALTTFVVCGLMERVEYKGEKIQAVIVGNQRADLPLVRGVAYVFLGAWSEHPRFGLRFEFDTYSRDEPAGIDAMQAYAKHALRKISFGPVTMERIWAAYGHEALTALADDPDAVGQRSGVNVEVCRRAAAILREDRESRRVRLALFGLLAGRGFPRRLVEWCMVNWGAAAPDLVRNNPFVLLEARAPGCSFARVSSLYLELGLDPDDPSRAAWCAWDAVSADREGHTWIRQVEVRNACLERLGVGTRASDGAIQGAIDRNLLRQHKDSEGRLWLALRSRAFNETSAVSRLTSLRATPSRYWPDPDALVGLTPHQREGLREAFVSSVALIIGSAGAGKTTVAMAVVAALYRMGVRVAVCGPTGRSAVRCTELLRSAEISDRATTIHRLLGVKHNGSFLQFQHGPDDPVEYQVVVVDEFSMVDLSLFASLLRALPRGAHLLLVGDPNQLPPVGHGAPLRDMIDADWPRADLQEVHRNAGRIAESCRQIRDGEKPDLPDRLALPYENLRHYQVANPTAILPAFRDLLRTLAQRHADGTRPWHPIDDVQVIVPRNAGGELSRASLNLVSQFELNPTGRPLQACPYRVGDKVIGLRNGYHRIALRPPLGSSVREDDAASWGEIPLRDVPRAEQRETCYHYVANGDVGRVLAISRTHVIAQFPAPDRVVWVVIRSPSEGDDGESLDDSGANDEGANDYLSLGYAVTAHKFQGAQNRVVIVIIDPDRRSEQVASKQWVYTGISRGQEVVFTIGDRAILDSWISRDKIRHRKTFFAHRLRERFASPA